MDDPSAYDDELDALVATFGADVTELGRGRLAVDLYPRAEEASGRFVEARIAFEVDTKGYPTALPAISVEQSKGLGGKREGSLIEALKHEACTLAGELMLGHLCDVRAVHHSLHEKPQMCHKCLPYPVSFTSQPSQVARDYLTTNNFPDYPCALCLEGLERGTDGVDGTGGASSRQDEGDLPQLLKLPCFHVFHRRACRRVVAYNRSEILVFFPVIRRCFERWWLFWQSDWAERERELVAHTGQTSVSTMLAVSVEPILLAAILTGRFRILQKSLPPKERVGAAVRCYRLDCPVCR